MFDACGFVMRKLRLLDPSDTSTSCFVSFELVFEVWLSDLIGLLLGVVRPPACYKQLLLMGLMRLAAAVAP